MKRNSALFTEAFGEQFTPGTAKEKTKFEHNEESLLGGKLMIEEEFD